MRHADRWTPQKLARRLQLIEQLDYRQRHSITPFKYMELSSPDDAPPIDPYLNDSDWETIEYNTYWGKWLTDFALRTTFDVPGDWGDSQVSLYLPLGVAGDFSHPETLAYIDGKPYASADRHHHEILLPDSVKDGQTHHLALHGWTGLGGWGSGNPHTQLFMKECSVVRIDQPTREFIAMVRVSLDVAKQLDDNSPVKGLLYNALDEAFKILDTTAIIEDSIYAEIYNDASATDAFYESVPLALDALKKGLAEAGDPMDVDIIGVGHAHIDVAWLWTLGQTRRKVGRTFSNVLRLMEQHPDYHFTQSQPQLYKYTEEHYPEIFEGIKERVKEGRWELIGGTWVEPDCNAIGLESLARQFLLGRNYFRKHFGDVDTPVLWLPDTFGYSWALPQLIKQAGMKYFITHKMSWNQYNHMPYQILWWQGIDGTKVLTHFLTTVGDYGGDLLPHATTYNGVVNAYEVFSTWNNFRQKEHHNELITAYGYGDGGGGPTREMIENIEQFKRHPGAPRVRPGTVREFMDRLEERGNDLPTWNGEFYFELHRGTLTSQARNKWHNRKSEMLLHDAEFLAAYAALITNFEYPHEEFTEAWELVCLNQFHDILPGSSITPVYEDSTVDYTRVRELAVESQENAISAIANTVSSDASVIAINPTSFGGDRVGLLSDSADGLSAINSDVSVITQSTSDGTLVALTGLAPFSITALSASENTSVDTGLSIRQDGNNIIMENALIRVTVDSNGEVSSVHDLEADRETVAQGNTVNQILAFEDRPMAWDAWDIDIFFEDRTENVRDVQSLEIIEEGPIRVGIEIKRKYRNSTINQRVYLTYNSKRIDFDTEIDWHEHHIFLKAAFPVDILSTTATYEIQWGNVERPTHRNTSWDWAKFETAAQKWGDISEGNYGVAVLNDSKYAYEAKDNELRLSLLKSATSPDPQADQGRHVMIYSMLPHVGDWRGQVIEQAYDLNDPIILQSVNGGDGSDTIGSLVSVNSANVTIETVKQAEDGNGIIVRLYENHQNRGKVTVTAGFDLAEAYHCNLLEENESQLEISDNQITMPIRPYQIATLRLVAK